MAAMVTQEDVRRIAMSLPGTIESPDHFAFSVEVKGKPKGFVWVWMERVEPKKPKVPNPGVVAIVVRNVTEKMILEGSDESKFVIDPHYNRFPAVLVKLPAIDLGELEGLVTEA